MCGEANTTIAALTDKAPEMSARTMKISLSSLFVRLA
jgi:hypothetical protein